MSSDDDGAHLMAAFKRKGARKSAPPPTAEVEATPVEDSLSDHAVEAEAERGPTPKLPATRKAVCVRVKPVSNRDDYVYYKPAEEVQEIVKQYAKKGEILYEVKLVSDISKQVSLVGKGRPDEASRVVKAQWLRQLRHRRLVYISSCLPPSPSSLDSPVIASF